MKNRLTYSALALLAIAGQSEEAAAKAPNVILIMCDDLGWGDVGFNGNTVIQTPHLDKMANDGVILNRFYSACAVSSPTRASVLTGRNPYRTGVFTANAGILRPEEVTIPELLEAEGYSTGHFGKWHVGSLTHSEKDANRGEEGNTKDYNPPKLHGYHQAFVTESKVPTWDPMKKPIRTEENKKTMKYGWNSLEEGEPYKEYGTYYWDIDGSKVTDNLEGDDSRIIMDRVIPFIGENVSQDKPFLAVIWFHTPHLPCVAGPEYRKLYAEYNSFFQNYAGCVTAMDEQVGRLSAYLSKLNVDKNTMIMFCSDNGPENCKPDGGGVTGGFKMRKRSLYEGGVRVPAFVVWPGKVKGGEKIDTPTWTCDYLPTIVEAIGVDKSKLTNEIDGIDIMPIVKGEQKLRNSPFVICFNKSASYNTDDYKIYSKSGSFEAYDIVNDKYETTPILNAPYMESGTEALKSKLEQYKASFEGDEYGTESVTRMNQKWKDPLAIPKKK